MPGAYAHITLVNLARDVERLEAADVPIPAITALLSHLRYCELGAVSPDFPYLHLGINQSRQWADLMHYERTGEPLKHGIAHARTLHGADQARVTAWLMGYAAHVVADLTIHPVIELRVGPYASNQTQHRICELNQDAHIFRRMNLDEVGRCEHLDSGMRACAEPAGSTSLNLEVAHCWQMMLARSYADAYVANEPDLDAWFGGFCSALDLAEEGARMPLFARHLATNCGLTYPGAADIDPSFIDALDTPDGPMDYDALFDKAIDNVLAMWAVVGSAIFEGDQRYLSAIGNFNLDTGKDGDGAFAFWHAQEAMPV